MTPFLTDTLTPYRLTPFSLATGAEITAVQGILRAGGLLGPEKRIAYLGLLDPARNAARNTAPDAADRRFRVFIHDVSGGVPWT
jgi:primary-amine oxidase